MTLAVAALALAGAVAKASACAITHDEAVTFALYVDGPLSRMFENYTAGNHLLFSASARASVALFGGGELAFRLPSLLSAAGVVVLIRRMLLREAPGAAAVAGLAAIAWNPLTLDYFAMARGYCLALLFVLVALELHLTARKGAGAPRAFAIGAALGCAVLANLAALVPAAALCCVVIGGVLRDWRKASCTFAALSAPIGTACVAHLAAMGFEIGRHHFWYGMSGVGGMVASFAARLWIPEAPVALVPVDEVWPDDPAVAVLAATVLPALFAVVLGSAVAGAARRTDARLVVAAGLTCGIAVAAVIAANLVGDVRYLRGRTGLILVVLLLRGGSALCSVALRGGRVARAGGAALLLVLCALAVRGVAVFRADRVGEGYAEAPVRVAFEQLERLKPAAPGAAVRVFAHAHEFGPGMDYYRLTRGAVWLAPVDRVAEPGVRYAAVLGTSPLQNTAVARLHFREAWRDAATGAVLLIPR